MKTARWITGAGSFVVIASAVFHFVGYVPLRRMIETGGIKPPLDGILKACWLTFSVQLFVLGIIAFVASKTERGGGIVLLCAASTGVTALLLLGFLGPFVGVYLTGAVTVLFLTAGWLQLKQLA